MKGTAITPRKKLAAVKARPGGGKTDSTAAAMLSLAPLPEPGGVSIKVGGTGHGKSTLIAAAVQHLAGAPVVLSLPDLKSGSYKKTSKR